MNIHRFFKLKYQHIRKKLRIWWNMKLFRLFLTIGKPHLAQQYFNRIPFPGNIRDESDFALRERKIWDKYLDPEGNLRLVTWKSALTFMLKLFIGIALGVLLISTIYNQQTRINRLQEKNKQLASQPIPKEVPRPLPESTPEKLPEGAQQLKLNRGGTIAVDMKTPPLHSGQRLYLPVVIRGQKGRVFYLPEERFAGQTIPLDNGRQARKFLLPEDKIIYYGYSTEPSPSGGEWLEPDKFKAWSVPRQKGPMVLPQGELARQLRSRPHPASELIQNIPKDTPVELLELAPISSIVSNFVWMKVKYQDESGKPVQGWIAAIELGKKLIEPESQANILKIAADKMLSFRSQPSTKASRLPGMNFLLRDDKVKFLEFAPLPDLLSESYFMVRVEYKDDQTKEPYIGWIAAAVIIKHMVTAIEETSKHNDEPIKQENSSEEGS